MRWKKINKVKENEKKFDHYTSYKPILAEEQDNQCVYCAIPDSRLGGIAVFHVEHLRPKSVFIGLENDYYNLFYVCPICNRFKGSDWPNEPTEELDIPCYPCPASIDYNRFLFVNESFEVESPTIAGDYIITRIYLNRPHLLRERKFFDLQKTVKVMRTRLRHLKEKATSHDNGENPQTLHHLLDAFDVLERISEHINWYLTKTPYDIEEVRRQKT